MLWQKKAWNDEKTQLDYDDLVLLPEIKLQVLAAVLLDTRSKLSHLATTWLRTSMINTCTVLIFVFVLIRFPD